MKKILFVSICLLVINSLTHFLYNREQSQKMRVYQIPDIDNDGYYETIRFDSSVNLSNETTSIYINNQKDPSLIINGYFINSKIFDIKKGFRVLEVEVVNGKSINSLVYKYQNGKLIRIPVSTEKVPYFIGVVSRHAPEFKDTDGDGILEMFTYYRYFPPEKKRKVEMYKFIKGRFEKQKQYEEETTEVYL